LARVFFTKSIKLCQEQQIPTRCSAEHIVRSGLRGSSLTVATYEVYFSVILALSTEPRSDAHAQRAPAALSLTLTCWLLVRHKLRSYFSPCVDQSSPHYISRRGRDGSLQRRFPIVDIWFRSGDIRDRTAKSSEIEPKKHVFWSQIFFGGRTPIFGPSFQNCTHFRSRGKVSRRSVERPRRSRAEKKEKRKEKKETAAKYKARLCVITQLADLMRITASQKRTKCQDYLENTVFDLAMVNSLRFAIKTFAVCLIKCMHGLFHPEVLKIKEQFEVN